jgi:nucleoside phosphorylase
MQQAGSDVMTAGVGEPTAKWMIVAGEGGSLDRRQAVFALIQAPRQVRYIETQLAVSAQIEHRTGMIPLSFKQGIGTRIEIDTPKMPSVPLKPREVAPLGIVTALEKEFAAVEVMLDDVREYVVPGTGIGRHYQIGYIPAASGGRHEIVLALGGMRLESYSTRVGQMFQHFPGMKHLITVGIASGIPHPEVPEDHVRLGDVVVSSQGGVVTYDFDKEETDRAITTRPSVNYRIPPRPPSALLLESVQVMRASDLQGERSWLRYIERAEGLPGAQRPPDEADVLYAVDDPDQPLKQPADPRRVPGQPRVFVGPIASANRLLRDPGFRDTLRDQFGVKAVEMEASGIADATWLHEVGYLVVRGICDYCDIRKNDVWQDYAAVVAAAYVRGLLAHMPAESSSTVSRTKHTVRAHAELRNPRVFISNAHSQNETARQLVRKLESANIRYFHYMDVTRIGATWKEELDRELQESDLFVALIDEDYHTSNWCQYELQHAFKRWAERRVVMLPYVLAHTRLPDLIKNEIQCAFLRDTSAETIALIFETIDSVVAELEQTSSGQQQMVSPQPSSARSSLQFSYQRGLALLRAGIEHEHKDRLEEFSALEVQLLDGLRRERLYGSTEVLRCERAKLVDSLNRLALDAVGKSFNDLCVD